MSRDYNENSIQVLSALDHMKRRSGMYIGSNQDARQLLSEIIDNAIDEVQAGFSNELIIYIDTKKNEYTVRDFGRGIPHGKKKLDNGLEKEIVEVLLTESNSGGKFNTNAYNYSCFTGDTKITLADGRNITFEQLLEEYYSGKDNYCYSCSNEGKISIEKIKFVSKTKDVNKLCVVTLDDGSQVRCTPEHRFMLRNGAFKEAQYLEKDDSLMPGRFGNVSDIFNSYDAIWDNYLDKFILCHHLADDYNVRNKLYTDEELTKTNRHHADFNKLNNNPTNIKRLTRSEHSSIHGPIIFERLKKQDPERYQLVKERMSTSHKMIWELMNEEQRSAWLSNTIHSDEAKTKAAEAAAKTLTQYNKSEKGRRTSSLNGKRYGIQNFLTYVNSEEGRKQHSLILKKLNEGDMQERARKGAILKSVKALLIANISVDELNYSKYKYAHAKPWKDVISIFGSVENVVKQAETYNSTITIEEIRKANEIRRKNTLDNNKRIQAAARKGAILKSVKKVLELGLELDEKSYKECKLRNAPQFKTAVEEFNTVENLVRCAENYNHRVKSVEIVSYSTPIPVYDLTISGSNHTFLLTSGVFVHNCGLNGLGITITNALSDFIQIETYRNGKVVTGRDENGSGNVIVTYDKTNEPNGTKVTFKPCKKYFHTEKIPVDFAKDRCRVASAMGFRARLIVDEKEIDTNATIFDLIKEEESSKVSTYVNIPMIEVTSSTKEKMKVAIRYTSETNDRYFGFTNLLSNYLGGTHVQELSRTVVQGWKEFVEEHKNIRPSVDLRNDDYLVGMRAVCAVFISSPEYSSQTKEKLVVNKKYFEELMNLFKKEFKKYLKENIVTAQQLLKRFEEYRISQNQLLSRKEISSIIKINNDSSDNIRRRSVVSKLVECTSRSRKDTDLYICEGDSAKGPFMFTRNPRLQAVLPLRGKILNITNKSVKDAIKNSEICDIANSIGCGIGSACDAEKSRYERIIIAADADPDGQQITCLVLSVFVNMFPDLVKAGRVYIAEPPLYCWGDNPKNYGWCNKVEYIPKGVNAVRFKGLGEMENSQLYHFLVNPETRNIKQVQFPSDLEEFNSILGTTAGKRDLLKELGIIEVEE